MEILALSILVLFSLIGFAAIFFTTFGTLIILIGAILYALMTGFSVLSIKALAVLATLYFVGEVLEYILIITGAKKLGASNAAVVGAIIGGIIGALLGVGFFGIGLILGTFLGIFGGAFLVELILQKDLVKSLKAGAGGVLGRMGSIIAKIVIAIIMLSIMVPRVIGSM
ncbi:MAG: DUF456 domain-containing protein [Candidatus Omnitrophica bacterium]|nr:DUF456 domain-containing protein [Candidatus Omnitrophota bacterium]